MKYSLAFESFVVQEKKLGWVSNYDVVVAASSFPHKRGDPAMPRQVFEYTSRVTPG